MSRFLIGLNFCIIFLLDIRGPSFSFGRDYKCDYVVSKDELPEEKTLSRISKTHFQITKDMGHKDSPIIIHDLSRNGTYVNGERIGQNKQRILFTGDKISVLTEDLFSKYSNLF